MTSVKNEFNICETIKREEDITIDEFLRPAPEYVNTEEILDKKIFNCPRFESEGDTQLTNSTFQVEVKLKSEFTADDADNAANEDNSLNVPSDYGEYILGLPSTQLPCKSEQPQTSKYADQFTRLKSRTTTETPFECKFCNKKFLVFTEFKQHLMIHNEEGPYKCAVCDLKFFWPQDLRDHKKSHIDKTRLDCNICGKKFKTPRLAGLHILRHEEEKFKCNICRKGFPTPEDLKIHENIHKVEKSFKCKTCGKCFYIADDLKNHEVSHVKERPFECNICGTRFARAGDVNVHKRARHTNTEEILWECKICGKQFKRQYVKAHQRTHFKKQKHGFNFKISK